MKTRSYLILMVLAVLLPVLAFSWVGLEMLLTQERQARLRAVQETARATALAIDQEIADAEGALRIIAQTNFIQSEDFGGLRELIKRASKPATSWTVVFDEEGNTLANTLFPSETRLPKADHRWIAKAVAAKKPSLSDLRISARTQLPVVSVNVLASLPNGKNLVVSQVFHAEHFNQFLQSEEISPTWIVGLFGTDGISIARNKSYLAFVGKPVRSELYEASLQQFTGQTRHVTRENIAVYSVYTHTNQGWTVAIGVPEEEIEAPARRAALYAALAMGLVFALAALATVILARRLTRSLDNAVIAAKVLGSRRVPEARSSGVTEVDVLQLALQDAGMALWEENQSRQALEKERERLFQSEQLARKQAEQQNKAKDEFLAMLGHELRNPLAPISAAADLLALVPDNVEQVRSISGIVSRQIGHMTSLIDDLLDVSRVTRGLVSLNKQVLDLGQIALNAVEQVRPLIDAYGHRLSLHLPSEAAWVQGDRNRLVQILTNLLNNSVKYTPPGGHIELRIERLGEMLSVSVSDNGIGMKPELVARAFDLFSQAERTPDRSQGGLGLGLALVKSLVEIHEGTVVAQSEGPGRGSKFTVSLPTVEGPMPAKEAETDAKPTLHSGPLNIMIVDDNADAANMLALLLKSVGHEVSVENDSKKALENARLSPPDVCLLDIGLPEMDGNELARRLRLQAETATAMLIAVTGYGQEEDQRAIQAAGFDHHLVKPVDAKLLISILAQVRLN